MFSCSCVRLFFSHHRVLFLLWLSVLSLSNGVVLVFQLVMFGFLVRFFEFPHLCLVFFLSKCIVSSLSYGLVSCLSFLLFLRFSDAVSFLGLGDVFQLVMFDVLVINIEFLGSGFPFLVSQCIAPSSLCG